MLEAHEQHQDTVNTCTVTKFSFWDRVKLLFGGESVITTRYETEFYVGRGRQGVTDTKVRPPIEIYRNMSHMQARGTWLLIQIGWTCICVGRINGDCRYRILLGAGHKKKWKLIPNLRRR